MLNKLNKGISDSKQRKIKAPPLQTLPTFNHGISDFGQNFFTKRVINKIF